MTEKRVKKLEIEWLMNGNTQILRYQRGPADVTVIWWEDFETKNKFIANYRSNSQIIICASLGALSALYHTWPEEIEFVGDIVHYYQTACQLAGQPWTLQNSGEVVPDYGEDND
jgi:hypothetical protein